MREVTALNQGQNWRRITGERLHFALEHAGQGIWDWDSVNDMPNYLCKFRIRARDGQWIWVLSRGTIVLRNADGKPLIMTGTMSDITGGKESEATK